MPRRSFFRSPPSPSRRGSLAARLRLELLEDRCQPALLDPVHYAVGALPQAVVTGHFNADTILDLAVANYDSSSVSVLLGNANGTFQPALTTPAGVAPLSVAVGDFNEDGNLDLAAPGLGGVSVLRGTGTGTFQPATTILFSDSPDSVAVGDFNADGNLDLGVTSNFFNPGSWGYYGYYPGFYTSQANVLLGNGQGAFAAPLGTDLGGGFHGAAVAANLNGDAYPDFAAATEDGYYLSVLPGSSSGTLGARTDVFAGGYQRSLAAGDVNGDGNLDLMTALSTGFVSVSQGNGLGSFGAALYFATGTDPLSATLADLNLDGNLDVVTANGGDGGSVSVLLGTGGGTFKPPITVATGRAGAGVAVGDFNRDGRPDVATANHGSNTASVLLNDGVWPAVNAPSITITDVTVTEGNTGTTTATFTVTLSAAYAQPVSVRYATADGSATAPGDYQTTTGTLTFNPGGPVTQTITVPVTGDRVGEAVETFLVRLSAATNAFLADASGTGTVVDDEPYLTLSGPEAVIEGNTGTTGYTFTVTLSAFYDVDVTVDFATANLTPDEEYYYGPGATAGVDYTATAGTLTIPAGQPSGTITVPIIGDRVGESSEFFTLNLSNPNGAQIISGQAFGNIVDDEPYVSLVDYPSGPEGNTGTSVLTFTVTLSFAYDVPVTVNYTTEDWTALAGSDYVAAAGTLTFAPDQTSLSIPVTINGDVQAESTENFRVTLSGLSAGTIGNGSVHGTIVDDDTPPSISIDDASIVEGNSGTRLLTFTVYLSQPSGNGVWVNYRTANGTAKTNDNDYVAKSGTAYFAPGETSVTITVVIRGDRRKEKDERFFVNLSGAINATIDDGQGVGTIENDDSGGGRRDRRDSSWACFAELVEDLVNGHPTKRRR